MLYQILPPSISIMAIHYSSIIEATLRLVQIILPGISVQLTLQSFSFLKTCTLLLFIRWKFGNSKLETLYMYIPICIREMMQKLPTTAGTTTLLQPLLLLSFLLYL